MIADWDKHMKVKKKKGGGKLRKQEIMTNKSEKGFDDPTRVESSHFIDFLKYSQMK